MNENQISSFFITSMSRYICKFDIINQLKSKKKFKIIQKSKSSCHNRKSTLSPIYATRKFKAYRRTDHLFGCGALLRSIFDVALKSRPTSYSNQLIV